MAFINFKIIIFIFILLSACTSQTMNKYSYKNSTQVKSNDFKNKVKLKTNKIDKEKLENLNVSSNSGQSVIFEFRKERYLEG